MASTLKSARHFDGQQNLTAGTLRSADQDLNQILVDMVSDAADAFAMIRAIAAKLDLDATVTDTDYLATADAINADPVSVTVV